MKPSESVQRRQILFVLTLIGLIAFSIVRVPGPAARAATADLFMSEYIEGTATNKAIEIYNGTGAAVNLATGNYVLQLFSNGAAAPSNSLILTGTIADGDVFVIANPTANAAILAQADVTSSTVINFNGDDAVVLRKGGIAGTILDVIGQVGTDPGTEWGTGLASTVDNTLRRKSTICAGDADGSNAFDPITEWDGFATNDSADLGSHTASCGGADAAPSVTSTNPADNATGVPIAANISVTFSEAVTAPAAAFSISCASSGAHTFVLSGGPTTFTLDPNSDFSQNEVCTVTVDDVQVADVDVIDPPDNMVADFVFDFTTVDPSSCGTAFTAIYTIQGSGTASPIVGTTVTTEGLVIGDFQGASNLSGFYIQDPTGDANTATSDGIFVFDGATPAIDVNPGDRVRVTGMIAETFNNTQIVPTSIIVCSTGNVLPFPVDYDLPEPSNNDLERVENMLVRFPETLTVTGNFLLGRFGELVLSSDGRLFQEHNFDRPGSAGALAAVAAEPLRYVLLDDGKSISNPDPTPYFDANNTRRVGDTVTGLTGVLTFDFSEYRLQPTVTPTFAAANPRTAAPDAVGGTVKVSSFNVLNYFNTFGNGNCTGGPGGATFDCRGATNLAEFNRQRDKIIAAIVAINADVTGVVEIENDGTGPTSAIQDLVDGLNTATAAGTYAFTEDPTPSPGTDAIKNSIIYKPARVTPDGSAVNDEDAIWTGQARNPLAQTFSLNTNGAKFVFIVNHFTSKSCSASDTGLDADLGQGCDNQQRTLQARALLEFVEERQTTTGEARVLVMGDLNAYGEEDPIFELEDDTADTLVDGPGGLIDLAQRLVPMTNRYSYQFDEQSGYLDHAMATKELNPYISGTTIWHINADEPTVLDYNTEFKSVAQQGINVGTPYRSSDHDPIVVGINLLLPTAADGTVAGRITDANGVPIAGAVVNLSGTQNRKFITDANGNYRFDNVETNGFYTVRPARANYSFSPAERSFSQIGNSTEAAFTGTPAGGFGNPLDTPEYFVRQHYLDFLGREPDESGFNFWSDQMLECGDDAECLERRRINVSAAYFLSIEFQETGGLVDGLYRASYGRRPRYAEFMPDTAAIAQNIVVGRGDWQQQLATNKRAFIEAFASRAAFRAAYDGLTNDRYVAELLAHTGVSYTESERDALVSGLNSGTSTRADVLRQISGDERFMSAKRNETFVMMEYFGYLRRDPDESGYQFWLTKLNQFGGNFEQAEMVKAFLVSREYRARFPR